MDGRASPSRPQRSRLTSPPDPTTLPALEITLSQFPPHPRRHLPGNLTLLPLPSYSPELNPVENVWQYLRQNQLSLRVWPDYDAIVATCCEAWNTLMAMPDRLHSITHREWAITVSN